MVESATRAQPTGADSFVILQARSDSTRIEQMLVEIGADLTEVTTLRNLMEGLKYCMAHQRKHKR